MSIARTPEERKLDRIYMLKNCNPSIATRSLGETPLKNFRPKEFCTEDRFKESIQFFKGSDNV